MSTPYNPGYGQPAPYRLQQVNFGWIGESWEIYRKAWLSWLALFLLPAATSAFLMIYTYTSPQMLAIFSQMQHPGTVPGMVTPSPTYTLVTNSLTGVQYLLNYLVACCASNMALRQVRGEAIDIGSIFQGLRNWVQMLVFCILFFLCSMVGAIACCIGLFVAYGLLMPGFAMVADGESGTNAISRSVDGMKVDWLNAALFSFVFYLIIAFGTVLTCFLGAFVLYPMMFIISALAYRDMIGTPNSGGYGAPPPTQPYGGFTPQTPGVWPPAPSGGQPPFGQSQYGQPPYGQPPAGQSPFGQPPPQPPYGQPPTGQSPFGQQQPQPPYGQPPAGQSPFGQQPPPDRRPDDTDNPRQDR